MVAGVRIQPLPIPSDPIGEAERTMTVYDDLEVIGVFHRREYKVTRGSRATRGAVGLNRSTLSTPAVATVSPMSLRQTDSTLTPDDYERSAPGRSSRLPG